MNANPPSRITAFNTLPIELNKHIAHLLDDHKDIAKFNLICRATRNAINGDRFNFWRIKFKQDFALPPTVTDNILIRQLFLWRWKFLRMFMDQKLNKGFVRGQTKREASVVRVLQMLINESYTGAPILDKDGDAHCLNMIRLQEFVLQSQILLGGRRPPALTADEPNEFNRHLAAVRLMCTHFIFDAGARSRQSWYAIDDAQKAVYAASNTIPLYTGPRKQLVNLEWMVHCMNFFRYHMTSQDSYSLYETMQELLPHQKPSPWQEPLKTGTYTLSRHWKGTYSYLQNGDLVKFRARTSSRWDNDGDFIDLNVDEGKIQNLELDFPKERTYKWPQIFEDNLHSLRNNMQTPQARAPNGKAVDNGNLRFTGLGEDLDDVFFASGWLNPLEDQKCGINGWQRITFMKHFDEDAEANEQENLWAYEGVVLPGGRIILGRWWFASEENMDFDNDYNGPFILWAVDPDDKSNFEDELPSDEE